jgi:hypothetical protein
MPLSQFCASQNDTMNNACTTNNRFRPTGKIQKNRKKYDVSRALLSSLSNALKLLANFFDNFKLSSEPRGSIIAGFSASKSDFFFTIEM